MPPNVLTLASQLRAGLEARDQVVLERLIRAYTAIDYRLKDKIELLIREIAEMERPNVTRIRDLARYRELMAVIELEMTRYQGGLAYEIDGATMSALQLGLRDGKYMAAAAGANLRSWQTPSMGAVEQAIAFLQKDGALYKRIELLAPFMVEKVSEALVTGITTGAGPIQTARDIMAVQKAIQAEVDNALGMGLSSVMNTTRTVTNWTYREANRASYIANEDIVPGWYWGARETGCASCLSMHGTYHTNDEPLEDHNNGECYEIPAVVGFDSPIVETGEDIFNAMSEAQQRELLGPGKWDALKSGRFEFKDLSERKENEVYGFMRTTPSLEDLLQLNKEPQGFNIDFSQYKAFEDIPTSLIDYDTYNLTIEQEESLRQYSENSFDVINDAARGYAKESFSKEELEKDGIENLADTFGIKPTIYNSSDIVNSSVRYIEEAIEKSPGVPENMILHRGFGYEDVYKLVENGELLPGSILQDKGFSSTSINEIIAKEFGNKPYPVELEIYADKGSKAIYLSRAIPGVSAVEIEAEFLLPRNAALEIISTRMGDDGIAYIIARYR